MKIIIVEDETIIRNGLVKHISWESLGINEIKVAANTQEALSICESYVPDIVVSDISMPGENGIVLCRKLRELFPEIEIIFVTGYADKEYLKAAIDLHAVRYVEKPINRKDISEAVQEAVSRYKRTTEQKEAFLHTCLLDSASYPICTIGKKIFRVGIMHFGQQGRLMEAKRKLTEGLGFWIRKNKASILVEISDSTTISFLLSGEEELPLEKEDRQEFIHTIRQSFIREPGWFLAMGIQVEKTENITNSWQSALEVGKALAYMGWNHVVFPEDLQGDHKLEPDRGVVERFTDAVSGKKEEKSRELLERFAQELEGNQIFLSGDIRHIYYSLNHVIDRAEQAIHFTDKAPENNTEADFFEHAETYTEMNQYLQNRLSNLFEDGESQKSTYAVKKVMDYIWENYGDSSLSIKTLADYVYLTPTYLSNIFKKSSGLTIGQYLVYVRVEKAKRLMKEPQLKFYEVASMVGYEDANYFAKIFKKKTNMTPSEYKESLSVR